MLQLKPEDFLLDLESDSDTENEIENLESTSPILEDEENEQNI